MTVSSPTAIKTTTAPAFRATLETATRDYVAFREQQPSVIRRYQQTAELLQAHCPLGNTVADIGSWPGVLTCCMQRMGWRVIAVDKAPTRKAAWKQGDLLETKFLGEETSPESADSGDTFDGMCRREGIEIKHCDIEFEPLPLADNSIDAVILTEVIEHLWHNPVFALAEMNRVLKPESGILLLSTPNFSSLRNRMNFLVGRVERVIENPFVAFLKQARMGHLGHLRLYSPREIEIVLRLLGFSSELHFARFEDLDHAASSSAKQVASSVSTNGQTAHEPRRESWTQTNPVARMARKLFRSPSSYARAAAATALKGLENLVPAYRPQMFVVARKCSDANFDRNHPDDVAALVMHNNL